MSNTNVPMLSQLDPNVNAQYMDAARRQAMAQALIQDSMTPINSNGVRISPLSVIAKVLSGYNGRQMMDQSTKDLANAQAKMAGMQYQYVFGDPTSQQGGGQQLDADASGQQQPTSAQPNSGQTGQQSSSQSGGNMQPSPFVNGNHFPTMMLNDPNYRRLKAQAMAGIAGAQDELKSYVNQQYAIQLEQQKAMTTGQMSRDGIIYRLGTDNQWHADPNSVKTAQQMTDFREPPIDVKTTTGQVVQMSRAEAQNYYNTGQLPPRLGGPQPTTQPPISATPGAGPDGLDVSKLSPGQLAQLAKINPQALQNGIAHFQATSAQPGSQPSAPGAPGTPQAPVGATGPTSPYGQVGVSQSPYDQELAKAEAKRVSDMVGDVQDKGAAAIQKVAANNKMIELLPQITTGPINKQITMLKNIGQSLGVDIGDPTANQEFDKFAIQGALQTARQIYGGRITNQDVQTQIASNPGATMGEKAIYQMLKWDNEVQQQHLQRLTALNDYRTNGGDLRNFPTWFAQKYPYQGITAPGNGQAGAFQVQTPPMPQPKQDNRKPLESIITVRQ